MALIKCKGCGQMVSTKAENCPKCGYSVRLSMEQEQSKQSVETHSTTEAEKKDVVNNEPQPQQRGSKKGIIIAIVVVVIIGCGVLFAVLNGNGKNGTNSQSQDTTVIADTEAIKQDELPSDSVAVEPNRAQDESFYTITKDGVANISLGKSMKEYNTTDKSEDEIKKLYCNTSFVEVQERTSEGFDYNVLYMNLYKDNEKIFSLYGGSSEEKPNVLNATVHSIFVYSPKFKLPNGIHVGMTAEELINNYGATLQLNENEGGESIAFITFDIPNLSDFIFVANKEDLLKAKGEYFLDGWNPQTGSFNENFRNDIEREAKKYCKLGIIVVGTEFDTF